MASGIKIDPKSRAYLQEFGDIVVILANARDVPLYIEKGIAAFGITGSDLVREVRISFPGSKNMGNLDNEGNPDNEGAAIKLGFGKCDICFASPKHWLQR